MDNNQRSSPASHTRIIDVNVQNTPRESVFGTGELLESILSFLLNKNLLCVQRVSRSWASAIDSSVILQQKMFLRPRDQPKLWILDKERKVGANTHTRRGYAQFNDTELKFRRVEDSLDDSRTLTPVTLNPLLENTNPYMANSLRMALGRYSEMVTYTGRIDALGDRNASFWTTYLTDPPCHRVNVRFFRLRFDDVDLTRHARLRPYIAAWVNFSGISDLTVESNAALTMDDILQACLTNRGGAISCARDT
jgi:hypothetical protein